MEKNRRIKFLTIVILVVAVCGLSVGLALFSNTLTISSSATVRPNAGEYKMKMYGFAVDPATINFNEFNSIDELFFKYSSTTNSVPTIIGGAISGDRAYTTASTAMIDNNAFTIKNISVSFMTSHSSGSLEAVVYYFLMLNEGAYDIFLNTSRLKDLASNGTPHVCTAVDPTKQALVEEYCSGIVEQIKFGTISYSSSGLSVDPLGSENFYKIEPGAYVALQVSIAGAIVGDRVVETGEFTVRFEDLSFEFSATDPYAGLNDDI